jgi:hypothetical protein
MDKKKKIITAIGTLVFITVFSVFIKFMLFPSTESPEETDNITITTPDVNEEKIPRKSKLKNYKQEGVDDFDENQVIKGLGESETERTDSLKFDQNQIIESNLHKLVKISNNDGTDQAPYSDEEAVNDQLKQIMALQNQVLDPSAPLESEELEDEETKLFLRDLYTQYGLTPEEIDQIEGIGATEKLDGQQQEDANGKTTKKPKEEEEEEEEELSKPGDLFSKPKNYFQGTTPFNGNENELELIPAETVDQAVVKNGSTIAIRTRQSINIKNPRLFIPKGAIIYGKVSMSTDRLIINIESYMSNNKLYVLDIGLYDFDGREGIHLGNRTWTKIPSEVTKDVYNYAYQKGTQASTFGTEDNSIDLDETKDIAILASAKHIGQEVFEKRRVFMPRKYHLWLSIKNQ